MNWMGAGGVDDVVCTGRWGDKGVCFQEANNGETRAANHNLALLGSIYRNIVYCGH